MLIFLWEKSKLFLRIIFKKLDTHIIYKKCNEMHDDHVQVKDMYNHNECKFEAEVWCLVQTWSYVRSHIDLPCFKAIS